MATKVSRRRSLASLPTCVSKYRLRRIISRPRGGDAILVQLLVIEV
jgi:hypothetical protein